MSDAVHIGETLQAVGQERADLEVTLSHEIVGLLSEQLYQSPLKAIEELVVNAFDADASECRLYLPQALAEGSEGAIIVHDDGIGMDEAGLRDLWHVGHSTKRHERVERQRKRKQIGKFGIGKLATYAVAHRVTYVTRAPAEPVLTTTVDYRRFSTDPTGGVPLWSFRWPKLRPIRFAEKGGLSPLSRQQASMPRFWTSRSEVSQLWSLRTFALA